MRLVASLTSTPARVGKIAQTVRSLLAQTRPFDAVYLWLPRKLARTGASISPDDLAGLARLQQEDGRLQLAIIDDDFGPATKLVPTLAMLTDPDAQIFYCDDDVVYGPEMVEWLVECSSNWPDAAVGVSLFDLDASQCRTTPKGQSYFGYRTARCHGQAAGIIEGFGGVLVQRRFFGHRFASLFPALDNSHFDGESGKLHPSLADDLVISCYLVARGVRLLSVQMPGCNRASLKLLDHGLGADSLQSLNGDGGPSGNLVRYTRLLPEVTAAVGRAVNEEKIENH